ncbi:MAG TPA: transglutaminase family protein [Polyangia bacterium]|nr:transglutaminase family protein [Polyangia bacterium]
MIYRVKHITAYGYGAPVSTSHHELHVLLRGSARQKIRAESLTVSPTPAVRRDRFDWFGNRATHLAIHERHSGLTVTAESEVEVSAPVPPGSAAWIQLGLGERPAPLIDDSWEATRDWVRAGADPEARAAVELVLPSPHIALSAEARAFAEPSFPAGRPLAEAAEDLMSRIHASLTYDPAATDVSTSVDEVLRGGRGVCQDFAHVQIACLRALGLPARYVSGYLVTAPIDGGPRLVGADASHAWLSVRSPSFGWLDLDPTNDVVPTDRHVVVAYGRDFDDVTPMRGVLLGGGRHQLDVSVDVAPVDQPE